MHVSPPLDRLPGGMTTVVGDSVPSRIRLWTSRRMSGSRSSGDMRPRIVHPQCDRTMTRGLQALSPKGQPHEGGSSPSGGGQATRSAWRLFSLHRPLSASRRGAGDDVHRRRRQAQAQRCRLEFQRSQLGAATRSSDSAWPHLLGSLDGLCCSGIPRSTQRVIGRHPGSHYVSVAAWLPL